MHLELGIVTVSSNDIVTMVFIVVPRGVSKCREILWSMVKRREEKLVWLDLAWICFWGRNGC